MIVAATESSRSLMHEELEFDYIVAGGGMTGVCSAITAARAGIRVALVQDRPVLGGNTSSEIRVWALGATSHMGNNNRWSREGGVIDEILVENLYRNKEGNPVLFDMLLVDKILAEKNIRLFLNTTVIEIKKRTQRVIESVEAFNPMNGTRYTMRAPLFADCTGDGTVAYMAGAAYRMGAELPDQYEEGFAPDEDFGQLMGHSLLFYYKDAGHPVSFKAPGFALKHAEKHIPRLQNPSYFTPEQYGCKYWWLEYGGRFDTVRDTELIKYELWKVAYGVWDYIKNSGRFPQAEPLTLEWVGLIPGKRESRRFTGYYTLTQQDIIEQRTHPDAVAYGGWAIDLHPSDGVYSPLNACTQWHSKGIYQIPYRCYLTPDIDNLFIGGRCISASHVANGSVRVMCTSALGGQAIGMAAAICVRENLGPADFMAQPNIGHLQRELNRIGHFIPGIASGIGSPLLEKAEIKVSSEYRLDRLEDSGERLSLEFSAALLIPVEGRMPAVTVEAYAARPTVFTVELRSSTKPANYTPDVIDRQLHYNLSKGYNRLEIEFDFEYSSERYIFICFRRNPDVELPLSDMEVSGITTVFNHMNPAVSNFGCQNPPEGIGVEAFEFWCPKRRPEQKNIAVEFNPGLSAFGAENLRTRYFRPYIGVNGWIAAINDRNPSVTLSWREEKDLTGLILYFDTDYDQALENIQMGHHESVCPLCIGSYIVRGQDGGVLFRRDGNYRSMDIIRFDRPYKGQEICIEFPGGVPELRKALMGIDVI